MADIYSADPFGNRAFYTELFGEETVEEMTTTGETRDIFPAITFRNVEDAELIAEVLRSTADAQVAYLRALLDALKLQTAAQQLGLPVTVLAHSGKETNPLKVIREKTTVLIRIGELLTGVIEQLGAFYEESSDTDSDTTYRKDLAEYAAGIAQYAGDVVTTIDALFAKNEAGE